MPPRAAQPGYGNVLQSPNCVRPPAQSLNSQIPSSAQFFTQFKITSMNLRRKVEGIVLAFEFEHFRVKIRDLLFSLTRTGTKHPIHCSQKAGDPGRSILSEIVKNVSSLIFEPRIDLY